MTAVLAMSAVRHATVLSLAGVAGLLLGIAVVLLLFGPKRRPPRK